MNPYGVPRLLPDGRGNPDYQRLWRAAHPGSRRAEHERYRLRHPEVLRAVSLRIVRADPEANRVRSAAWRAANPGKVVLRNRRAKARRWGLEVTVELGRPFPGSHLHHLTPSAGVYVPAALNRSVAHNALTGEGMAEVNALAMDYYYEAPRPWGPSAPRTPSRAAGPDQAVIGSILGPVARKGPEPGVQTVI